MPAATPVDSIGRCDSAIAATIGDRFEAAGWMESGGTPERLESVQETYGDPAVLDDPRAIICIAIPFEPFERALVVVNESGEFYIEVAALDVSTLDTTDLSDVDPEE